MTAWIMILVLTLVSGVGDAAGFLYAAKIWNTGFFSKSDLVKSAAGFTVGISAYWAVIKFLSEKNIVSPELQSLYWFLVTMLSISLLSGRLFQWPIREKIIGGLAVCCISWLIYTVE